MSKILLLNCGSSSIKYQLLDPTQEGPEAVGLVQRIGQGKSTLDHEVGTDELHVDEEFADHTEAVAAVVKMFADHGPSLDDVVAVGHRTVHGGSTFVESTLIDAAVLALTAPFLLLPGLFPRALPLAALVILFAPAALRLARRTSVIASAAAVPSSSSEALAVGSPVRSPMTVWKVMSASSRPWEISGWYGV